MPNLNIKHSGRGVCRVTGMRAQFNGRCHPINFNINIRESSPIPDSLQDKAINNMLVPQIVGHLIGMEYIAGGAPCIDCEDCTEDCTLKEDAE